MSEKDKAYPLIEPPLPVISEATMQAVLSEMGGRDMSREHLMEIHPDIDMVEFSLGGIRKTLTPPIAVDYYNSGLEAFLLARDRELASQPQYVLSPDAVQYIRSLLGTQRSTKFAHQARDLNEKLLSAYQQNPDIVPTIDPAPYRTIGPQAVQKTRALINSFPRHQPLAARFLEQGFYSRRRIDDEEKTQLQSMALGIVDGDSIFRSAQEARFFQEHGSMSNRFRSFFK